MSAGQTYALLSMAIIIADFIRCPRCVHPHHNAVSNPLLVRRLMSCYQVMVDVPKVHRDARSLLGILATLDAPMSGECNAAIFGELTTWQSRVQVTSKGRLPLHAGLAFFRPIVL